MKEKRQIKILELIQANRVETQEELAELLRESGFDVTQATVSRDIKDLKLVKVPDEEGGYCYDRPSSRSEGDLEFRARRIFTDSIVTLEHTDNLIVIKTRPGNAQSVCVLIDDLNWEQILGTIAGEDTILIITRSRDQVDAVLSEFNRLMR